MKMMLSNKNLIKTATHKSFTKHAKYELHSFYNCYFKDSCYTKSYFIKYPFYQPRKLDNINQLVTSSNLDSPSALTL